MRNEVRETFEPPSKHGDNLEVRLTLSRGKQKFCAQARLPLRPAEDAAPHRDVVLRDFAERIADMMTDAGYDGTRHDDERYAVLFMRELWRGIAHL